MEEKKLVTADNLEDEAYEDEELENESSDHGEEVPAEEDLEGLLQRINEDRAGDGTEEQFFKIKSDIGKDDYRAFVYHSVLRKTNWVLPVYIILPPAIALVFGFANGQINLSVAVFTTVFLYLAIAGVIVFRSERSLSKRNKDNPDLMKLTPTTFTFMTNAVINSKKTGQVRVPYSTMIKVCETKMRFILYFDNKKAMILRSEDVRRDADIDAFRTFIHSKTYK